MPRVRALSVSAFSSVAFLFLIGATAGAAERVDLTTHAERTKYRETGRYEEVQRLCTAFESAYPEQVRCREFGRSPEGRPMLVLIASADGAFEPAKNRELKRPVVLMQGGIHAGEIDGKDAGFRALRDLAFQHFAQRAACSIA